MGFENVSLHLEMEKCADMKKRRKTEEELRRENEERRRRISQEFGGIFDENDPINPELENLFLRNVERFEEQFAKAKKIKVYDRLEKPEWIPHEDLNEEELEQQLESMLQRMWEYGIALNTICEVEDRELYRFITEELFEEVMDDVDIPDMICNFIYEDYYPNHVYNVKQVVTDFINILLQENCNVNDWFFNEQLKVFLREGYEGSEAYTKVKNFVDSYTSFYILDFSMDQPRLSENIQSAKVRFNIHYKALMEDSDEELDFEGKGTIELVNIFNRLGVHGWEVTSLDMPAFSF